MLPENAALDAAAATLAAGWHAMGDPAAKVLMVVQPEERNVFDQRWIAARLWEVHGVRTVRATLREIHDGATVGGATVGGVGSGGGGEPGVVANALEYGGDTFSVVYFRAGYTPGDYPSEAEWRARELLERSAAVKSPSAAMHLAGTKKVQQVLAAPGVLERFVPAAQDAADMRRVFAGLYALDGENAATAVAQGLADPEGFVLKPQREGGGNNLYGEELTAALQTFDPAAAPGAPGDLSAYILMQRILPPLTHTLCLRAGQVAALETVSELGVYTGYLRIGEQVVMNRGAGHLLRTKAATSDEGGVAAGFAVLDSPHLY
jgi:glutathione synthase